ncbi:hypothetical protein APHAL10511_003575 [Amanita phalloides]|nr:hypothetical protein APHAL10511_003575 [Amanita phalloides]
MKYDPFTLRVALDKNGNARGELYLDDGVSYNYQKKQKNGPLLKISNHDLGSANLSESVQGITVSRYDPDNAYVKDVADVRVEKIVVVGLNEKPTSVKVEETGDVLAWEFVHGVGSTEKGKEGVASVLTIRDPKVPVARGWTIGIYLCSITKLQSLLL